MMKCKLVIFDFDGTLADSFPYFLGTISTLAETYHFPPINPEDVDQLRGMDARQLMGVQLAIVSSNSEANIRRVLGSQAAAPITYYGCGTSLLGKQHKFKKAVANRGVTPSEVLCVGDEVRDLEAAKGAAVAFGAVAWGYTRVDVLEAYPDIALFYTADDIVQTVPGTNPPGKRQEAV